MKTALVLGGGGFIGSHLVEQLKKEGFFVRAVDLKYPEFKNSMADEFILGDLRKQNFCQTVIDQPFDELYQLAADMGGAGFTFTGDHDADIMHNSAIINLHVADLAVKMKVKKLFYSSSACIYPLHNQEDVEQINLKEDSAYPAFPDSEYGWEKLFSERLYLSYKKNYNLPVKIARFHNIYGDYGLYDGGREKAPAAICRKVVLAPENSSIEIWGTGDQYRSFLYISECLKAVRKLMDSDFDGPVNIGSDEMISINALAKMVIEFSGKNIHLKHIDGPIGVKARNSDNALIQEQLNWAPDFPLKKGMKITYDWIKKDIKEDIKNGRSTT